MFSKPARFLQADSADSMPDAMNDAKPDSLTRLRELLMSAVHQTTLRTVVLSKPRLSSQAELRVDVRPVSLQSGMRLQFTTRTRTQQLHLNLTLADASEELWRLASEVYRDIRLVTDVEVWEARFSKKQGCYLKQRSAVVSFVPTPADPELNEKKSPKRLAEPRLQVESHNRGRTYLIPEGTPCPFLIHTGIMNNDGHVRAKHYHKFRQINRFLEFIHNILDRLPQDQTIQVVDFGCGKSYLTFATHHLLTQVCGRSCEIIGLDRRADVVQTCQTITQELGLKNLRFEVGQISDFNPQGPVHLAMSLHACDTATDEALMQAIQWNSDVIMAVPCCQHELSSRLQKSAIPLLTSHGILKEHYAALATDAMRAAVLNAMGYEARVMEFIDLEHTAKNLLIRAVRTDHDSTERHQQYMQQLRNFRTELAVRPLRLEKLLTEGGWIAAE